MMEIQMYSLLRDPFIYLFIFSWYFVANQLQCKVVYNFVLRYYVYSASEFRFSYQIIHINKKKCNFLLTCKEIGTHCTKISCYSFRKVMHYFFSIFASSIFRVVIETKAEHAEKWKRWPLYSFLFS